MRKQATPRAPTLEAYETGKARARSRDSSRGEPPEEGSRDETLDGPPQTTSRVHQPRAPTHRFARRERNNLYKVRDRLGASSRRPRGSAYSWRPRARQTTTRRPPVDGAPRPTPTRPWLLGWNGFSERRTTPKQLYSCVKHADVATMRTSSRRRLIRERPSWCWIGRAEPGRLRQEISRPPCIRRACTVSLSSYHGPGTTTSSRAASRAQRLQLDYISP